LTARWTARDWLVPWSMAALSVAELSLREPRAAPALASLAALAIIPFRSRPWRFPRWAVYALALPFLAAFATQLTDLRETRTGWEDLGILPGWYFAFLSVLLAGSVGRSSRPIHAGWTAFAAQILSGPVHSPWTLCATIVQTGLVLVLVRPNSAPPGSGRLPDLRLLPPLAMVAVLTALLWQGGPHLLGLISPHARGTGSFRSLKGFSPVVLLGSFADEWGRGDEEVAARAYSPRPPTFLTGVVRDVYGAGAWRTAGPGRTLPSPRNLGDATVFCRDGRDPGVVPSGWLRSSAPTQGYLLLPSNTACEAVVGDVAKGYGTGSVVSPDADPGRGIWWYADTGKDTSTTPFDLAVPRGLAGLLDSALAECAPDPGDRGSRNLSKAISSWFTRSFRYTLSPGWTRGEDPLRAFLRERRGYCEYFATAAVLLLRRAGIPARYATGYAYPDRDPGGAWTFRRSNAHAWVRILDPRLGWIPFDPTPASDRPSRGVDAWTRTVQDMEGRLVAVWHGIRDGNWRNAMDRISDRWSGRAWFPRLAGIALLAALALLLFGIRRKSGLPRSQWQRRLDEAESRLRRESHLREPGETVGRFLLRLPPQADRASAKVLRDYQERRFAP